MKNLRKIVMSSVFVLAVGMAFAFKASRPFINPKGKDASHNCVVGTLEQDNCLVANTNAQCTVTVGTDTGIPAYDGVCDASHILRQP